MKPFSARYFVTHNRRRALALIFMIAVTALCYVGGIYVTSPQYHSKRLNRPYQDYATLYLDYPSTQEDYDSLSKTILSLNSVKKIVPFSTAGYIQQKNEMRIENSLPVIALTTEDDFKLFSESIPEVASIQRIPGDGELIISSALAKNASIKIGDELFDSAVSFSFSKPFHVILIIESDNYFAYGVDTTATPYSALVLRGVIVVNLQPTYPPYHFVIKESF